ncbi:hypothetical protein, partial [Dickeya dianthicola]|uniref:hypothetical protein n=1 Tax=Dickeya dianthicola TaxID=204039 RepID=UPI001F618C2F
PSRGLGDVYKRQRLNYRGIVGTGRMITGSVVHVKGVNHIFDAFGEGMRNMPTFSHDHFD